MSGFDPEAYRRERHAENWERMRGFAERRQSAWPRTFTDGMTTVLVLGEIGNDPSLYPLRAIMDAQRTITATGIFNNCYAIAARTVHEGLATGAAHTPSGTSDFIGYANHSVSIIQQPNGRVLAVDFTAAPNIDYSQGNFDTLIIGANDESALMASLGELYGGNWTARSGEDIRQSYLIEYGSREQRMAVLDAMLGKAALGE